MVIVGVAFLQHVVLQNLKNVSLCVSKKSWSEPACVNDNVDFLTTVNITYHCEKSKKWTVMLPSLSTNDL